jgi:hypothetical protein
MSERGLSEHRRRNVWWRRRLRKVRWWVSSPSYRELLRVKRKHKRMSRRAPTEEPG